jgi:hypothetical protein
MLRKYDGGQGIQITVIFQNNLLIGFEVNL